MPAGGLLAGAMIGGPIVGGLVGNVMAQKDRAAQKKAMKEALNVLFQVGYPPDLSKEIIVQELQRQGVYTPQLEEDLSSTFKESEFSKLQEDPIYQQIQKEALGGIRARAKVGLSAEDRAALNQVRSEVQRDAEAKRQQVLQQLQAAGMGGSGAALIAQLGAGQEAANLASQQSDALMGQASSAKRQALEQLGRMSGEMQQSEFNRKAELARALDERERFLQENSIARQRSNVGALNQAQQINLAEQQRIHEANIAAQRAEKERQVAEQGRMWDRNLKLGTAKANVLTGQATQLGQQAQATAQGYANMGTGVATAAGGIGSAKPGSAFGNLFSSSPTQTATPVPISNQYSGVYTPGQYSGYAAEGGIVGDPNTAGGATIGSDNVNMNLREGEMVLNADQQAALFDFLKRIGNKFPKD